VRLRWPWRRTQNSAGEAPPSSPPLRPRPSPRPARRLSEVDLLARLEGDVSIRGGLDRASWEPTAGWVRPAVQTLARTAASDDTAEAGYRALRDSALLLGDVLLGGTDAPDFAASLEGIEAYLTPYFPREMESAFPALLEEAARLHRQHASRAQAAARLGAVLRRAFGG